DRISWVRHLPAVREQDPFRLEIHHSLSIRQGQHGSAILEWDLAGILGAGPNGRSDRELGRLRQPACVVEVAMRQHDVGDVSPLRTHARNCAADQLRAPRNAGIDKDDTPRAGHHETADLEGHRAGTEHAGRYLHLGDHRLDVWVSHEARIAPVEQAGDVRPGPYGRSRVSYAVSRMSNTGTMASRAAVVCGSSITSSCVKPAV